MLEPMYRSDALRISEANIGSFEGLRRVRYVPAAAITPSAAPTIAAPTSKSRPNAPTSAVRIVAIVRR